jgi:cytochrome c551/c552
MKRGAAFLGIAALLAGNVALAGEAPASMTHHRCYICHSDHQALAGPAFADIAVAYRNTPNAAARVADVIRSGAASGGPWHMPPHPEITPREAQAMARYILSLDAAPRAREVKAAP